MGYYTSEVPGFLTQGRSNKNGVFDGCIVAKTLSFIYIDATLNFANQRGITPFSVTPLPVLFKTLSCNLLLEAILYFLKRPS